MRLKWIPAAGLLTSLFVAELAGGFGGHTLVRFVDDLGTIAAALLAAVLCLRAARNRPCRRLRTFWRLLGIGLSLWCLGEIVWAVYDLALSRPVPVPSWADALYLAAPLFVAAALLAHPALHGRTTGKARAVLDGSAIATALFFVAWTALLGPLWRSTDLSTLGGLVTLAYPVTDVVLLFLVVLVIRGTTSRDRRDVWLLLAGLAAMTLSDSGYAYLTEVARYGTGNLVDIGWVAGYLAVGAGAYAASRQRAADSLPRTPPLTRAALVGPFVPVLTALTLIAVEVHITHRLDRVGWISALVLVLCVLLRQLLLAVDLAKRPPDDEKLRARVLSLVGGTRP